MALSIMTLIIKINNFMTLRIMALSIIKLINSIITLSIMALRIMIHGIKIHRIMTLIIMTHNDTQH